MIEIGGEDILAQLEAEMMAGDEEGQITNKKAQVGKK